MTTDRRIIDGFLRDLNRMQVNKSPLGEAKKKPLLVLLVVAMLKEGSLSENQIRYTDIDKRLSVLITRYGGRPTESGTKTEQPFFHLRTSPFWHLTVPLGRQTGNRVTISRKSLLAPGAFAQLSPQVFELLRNDDGARDEVINAIVERWWEKSDGARIKSELGIV